MDKGTGAAATRPVTIVVADDSASLRSLVRITLASQGWTIAEAETPPAALSQVRAVRPDLVLLDITFGDTGPDGLAICAELKNDPATSGIPIVVLTGHDDPAERRRAEAAGANAFITKPFGPLDLMRVVRELIPTEQDVPALGVYLLDAGAVHPKQLEAALDEQRALGARGTAKRLGDVLVDRGAASSVDVERALLRQMHARVRDISRAARVVVVDDHPAVREGLRQLIASDAALELVGEAADAEAALRLAGAAAPDVILLDNEMPGRHGLEILSELRAIAPSARIVMFSLEHAVRDHALRGGAAAFIPKDAPPDQVLRALRVPSRATPPDPIASTAHLPRFPHERRMRRTALVLGGILVVYIALFLVVLEPAFGASAGAFSVATVAIAGALLGPEAGLVAAFLTLVVTGILWSVTGHVIGEPVLEIGGSGIGIVLLLLVGAGSGVMRDVGARLDRRGYRIEALAEVAETLGGLTRSELVDVFLEAMRRVLPAHAVLLYGNVAGDASFIGATDGGRSIAPDKIAALVRQTLHAPTPRVVEQLPEAERPAAGMSSALIVPVSIAPDDVRGAIVLLHRDAKRYHVDDAQLVRPFAEYLWILMRHAAADRLGSTTAPARRRAI